ncbi:MAG: hypothetical protein ACKOQ2_23825, partial [Dolichospermum sp.]
MRPSTRLVVLGKKLWTPAQISTALWLDAADASTIILNGSTVSQWRDKSGNGRNATQATAANQPVLATNSQNGQNGITFDGVNDYLVFSSALLQTTHSLFIVFKPTIKSVTGTIFGQWASGQTGRYLWNVNQNCLGVTASGRLNVFNSTTTQGDCSGGFAKDVDISNTATLIESLSTTGTEQWKLFKNGTEWESSTITSVYTGIKSSIGSLNATTSNNPYDGIVYEVIHLSTYASTT